MTEAAAKGRDMRLELLTWPKVRDYLARSKAIVVPMGSTEQHGPEGLIGTDHLCPQAIARRMGAAHGAMVAPTIQVGMSQFHLDFPGSLSLRPSTLMAVVRDHIASLARTGFERVYFLNGHGGNVAPTRAAIQEYYAELSMARRDADAKVRCKLKSWWELPRVDARRKALYGAGEGFHGTPSELAITMAAHPEAIAEFALPPPASHGRDDLLEHAGDNYYEAADFRRRFPDGRVISDSAQATRAAGEALLALAVEDLAEDFARFAMSA
ncbi:MAG: creatininase family protein [Tagaea sp.]